MKKMVCVFVFSLLGSLVWAQRDSVTAVFAFPITEYMPEKNDSLAIVQVQLPDASVVDIGLNRLGVLRRRYQSGRPYDTAVIGWGRCRLVKGDHRYFGIHLNNKNEPQPGDLLFMQLTIPLAYNGYLFPLSRNYIHLQMVDDRYVYRREDVYTFTSAADENKILDSLVADIRYTGRAMSEQGSNDDQLVNSGMFKGQKMFAAMQAATRSQLISFLKYMNARPQKYAGHSWKISEIFATWMVSGAPEVIPIGN
jgi:hypothetical protein